MHERQIGPIRASGGRPDPGIAAPGMGISAGVGGILRFPNIVWFNQDFGDSFTNTFDIHALLPTQARWAYLTLSGRHNGGGATDDGFIQITNLHAGFAVLDRIFLTLPQSSFAFAPTQQLSSWIYIGAADQLETNGLHATGLILGITGYTT